MKWVILIFLLDLEGHSKEVNWRAAHTQKECEALRAWEHLYFEKTTSDILVRSKCVNLDNFHNKIK